MFSAKVENTFSAFLSCLPPTLFDSGWALEEWAPGLSSNKERCTAALNDPFPVYWEEATTKHMQMKGNRYYGPP
jgi:hypothetical protein